MLACMYTFCQQNSTSLLKERELWAVADRVTSAEKSNELLSELELPKLEGSNSDGDATDKCYVQLFSWVQTSGTRSQLVNALWRVELTKTAEQ